MPVVPPGMNARGRVGYACIQGTHAVDSRSFTGVKASIESCLREELAKVLNRLTKKTAPLRAA